jgi:hypothetical protein
MGDQVLAAFRIQVQQQISEHLARTRCFQLDELLLDHPVTRKGAVKRSTGILAKGRDNAGELVPSCSRCIQGIIQRAVALGLACEQNGTFFSRQSFM